MEALTEKMDMLSLAEEKSITKSLQPGQTILLTCAIFKFNDYKKKQERSLMVTNKNVYNLKGKGTNSENSDIRRKIELLHIKAITVSKIGTQFVLHVPNEYDYRYASADKRDKIIYAILKGWCSLKKQKMPIYYKEDLSLVNVAMTKDEKKKSGIKELTGECKNFSDQQYKEFMEGQEQEKEMVRKTTRTLFAKDNKETVTLADFIPRIVLGRGAFGTVLLVQKKNTKELFAMKSLNKQDVIKKDQLEHTKTQKMVLQHINHPFLVNLAYAFQTPTKLHFIMQFMRGGQLFQHLTNARKFPEKRAKFYAMQITLALGHLHSQGIMYRDLKLENVLMDQQGNVCLTDFGMAKILKDGQLATTFCGTPEYLAPEVIGGGGYGKAADWWSLGILTYEMMYGLPPFYNKQQNLMFKLIKQGELRFSQKVDTSKQAKDFITKLLNRNPAERLGSKNDMQDILNHPWFKQFSVQKMMKKEIATPFKPKTEGDDWLDGFDKEFTSEKAIYEQKQAKLNEKYNQMFKDF